MKRRLLASIAALAAGGFATAVQASDPIRLELGGYMEYWAAAAQQDGDFKKANRVNNFDIQGEGEVWFLGKTTLDNGLNVAVRVELENGSDNNGADIIDEVYMTLSGRYGQLTLGSTDNIAYKMRATAPNAAYTEVDDTAIPAYLLRPDGVVDNITDLGFDGDANKISYMTPKVYGFQFGVSYIPSNNIEGDDTTPTGGINSESVVKAASFDQAWAFGLSWDGKVGPVGILATAGYTVADLNPGTATNVGVKHDSRDYAFGLNLTYEGWTLGGAWRGIRQPDSITAFNGGTGSPQGYAWDAGLMYAEGPYAVSVNYRKSSAEGDTATAGKDTIDMYAVGGKYTLGPGVDLFAQVAYAKYKDEDQSDKTLSNDGAYGGVVGLHLDF